MKPTTQPLTPLTSGTPDELFRLLVSSVRDYAIFMLDPSGRIATWNAGAARFKGYTADEIVGRHFSLFYPEADVQAGKCEMELEVATREGRFEEEGWRIRKDGSQFWAHVTITAVRDEAGHMVGFAKVTRDLTERRREEEERAARKVAEQANKAKDEFIAMLGHELRNPLAPIVTALQLIKMRGETGSQRELAVIERQVNQMMHLVDDMLDVSRIASGKVELKKKHFDLRETISKAVEIAAPLVDRHRHTLHIDVEAGDLIIDGDEPRVTQIVANLLTNAAKYTEPGGEIRLRVRHVEDKITIEVRDSGIGISAELLPRVFDLFVQASQSSDRATGGLGLGLTLASSLVRMHGGEIKAESEGLGKGSAFTVTLPAVHRPAGARSTSLRTSLNVTGGKQRVLIVDDNEDARLLLSDILRAIGHDVATAPDGLETLKLIETFVPDVAILDIGLPDMDGYELASRLRGAVPKAKLIALSGYGQESDRAKSHSAGFDRHLVKPVDIRSLLAGIGELAER